jgi:glycosyltransferase involved in cell wall biosynthesis
MRKTLAMIVRNEEAMLRRTLPVMAPLFDEISVVDTGSSDGTVALLESAGARVLRVPWTDDYSRARNAAITLALDGRGDAIFMFDADEAVYPDGLATAARALETSQAVSLPRVEFVFDLDHYNPDLWPDYQCRFFCSDAGARFVGAVHEVLLIGPGAGRRAFEVARKVDACPIYHYGQTKPISQTVLRHYNYGRIAAGRMTLGELPPDVPLALHHNAVKFIGPHPLRPIST